MTDPKTNPAQAQYLTATEAAGGVLVEYTGMRAMVGADFYESPMMVTPKISEYLEKIGGDGKTLLIIGLLGVAHSLGQEGLGYRHQLQELGLVAS